MWKNIAESKEKRPKVQNYKNWKELPPIPISLPCLASIGETGDWRVFRPILIKEKCNKCGFCWMYCPEGVIHKDENGDFVIDYVYCKGCGICAKECPSKSIEMKMESEVEG